MCGKRESGVAQTKNVIVVGTKTEATKQKKSLTKKMRPVHFTISQKDGSRNFNLFLKIVSTTKLERKVYLSFILYSLTN